MLKNWIGAAVLTAAAAFVAYPADEIPPAGETEAPQQMLADVHILKPEARRATVTTHGQVRPRWQSRLSAEVGGRVVSVSSSLLTGARFQQGELLAQIEDSTYRSAAASARSELATAERALLEEEQRGKLALENWKASGLGGQASGLTLRQPQLAEARAAVDAARAALAQAEYELQQTRITAPFDGVVASRSLNPGEVVQAGSQIAEVFDTSVFEATAPLSASQFAQLGTAAGAKAVLSSAEGGTWQGQVVRIDPSVDTENRWINAVIQMQPGASVMPGQFVTIKLQGRRHDALYAVPEGLISPKGQVWYLTPQDRLQAFEADPVFTANGVAYIIPPQGAAEELRLAAPRSGYLRGAAVQSRIVSEPRPGAALRAASTAEGSMQ
ncbi:efflux RND transporter periplasmic adaptor subunit [Leisingera sp. ANG-Vp]|uniref:efflux RND transporter periplasmic adaptor subunit n=1 Tax=Leisingera sp. ANG-Vp TaxID=1577896 RepID=UPI00068ACF56|nr:efflux RND transporter periplasmic adaptor subunit [Leisingera sp. ANG-Vp]